MSDTKQSCCSTDEVGCVDPDQCRMVCENPAGCTNIAYPKLVIELMPTGLKGVMLAAMMAALMSSLTSVFNSSATIFTIDIWKRFRIAATETEMLVVGRVFVLILIGLSIVWVPVLQASQGGQLFNYIQAVTGYFAPPILALFLLAILWERTNEQGAFWGLMVGLVIGIVRMALDFGYGSPDCGEEDTRPVIIRRLHFLHFTILLFVVSFVATVVITVLTPPIKKSHLIRLTWWTRHSEEEREEFPEEKARHEKVKAKIAAKVDEEEFKVSDTRTLPAWRRFLYAFCGYEQPKDVDMSQEEESAHKKLLTSVREDRRWKWFVNINALILITFGGFLWGFFG
ncbi:sodium/glucose cotransporter 4-like [Pomacea canaliculata]|uniref:sodium/glucose cotransporter 4-like n=1 Tax=Pomacea canaliculata TaxID=400727 RepID=UPI000D72B9B9|nr:sodium/glucose cotransporter 4-like [Pomacea canaliculata]